MTNLISDQDVKHFARHGWVQVGKLHSRAQVDILLATMDKGFANPPDIGETYGAASRATPRDVVSNQDPRAARYPHLALNICRAPRYGVRHGNPKPRQAYAEYARGA